jgi:hypothetical protein
MRFLYLTGHLVYGSKLREVNNTYRAKIAGAIPGVWFGGQGFDAPIGEPLWLPGYVRRVCPHADVVFLADPWHNFWDPCPDYPNCPPLYTGIDELGCPVIIESGDSQFYYAETIHHLQARPRRAVAIRALSHRWRFSPGSKRIATDTEPLPPENLSVPIFYLPHGAYPEMVEASLGVPKQCDVLFSGSDLPDSYPARARIATALRRATDIHTVWLPHPSDSPHDVIGPKFWKEVAGARIAVAGTNAYRNLTMRYLEIPASGTLAIGDLPYPECNVDAWGDHMIDIGDAGPDEIADMVRVLIRDQETLVARTDAARSFVLSSHYFSAEFARFLSEVKAWIS